jgi:hypothetical protein
MSLHVQTVLDPTSTEEEEHTTIEVFVPKKYKGQYIYLYIDEDSAQEDNKEVRVTVTKNALLEKPSQHLHKFQMYDTKKRTEPSPTLLLGARTVNSKKQKH